MTSLDILNFAKKNNIKVNQSESIIIYNFIKRNHKSILNGDESSLKELKGLLREDLYHEIIKLYMYYKNKLF